MAGVNRTAILCIQTLQERSNFIAERLSSLCQQIRGKKTVNYPKLREPIWFSKKERTKYEEHLTSENKSFISEVINDMYTSSVLNSSNYQTPLKVEPLQRGTWAPGLKRTGLIAKKIGIYPLWKKDGTKVYTTLLQVLDNHVIKYTPPEEYKSPFAPKTYKAEQRHGCLLIGAESADPQRFTKEYCGLFKDSGVMPKLKLCKFMISPEAAIQPGTPLYASHFKVGDYVDVVGKTIYRGFQGVVVRWGFKGGPASHGVTKTHRRPGNIGGGGEKARVWPGTKMPGHMGNRYRYLRGLKILRINTKYNVLWVQGQAIAGDTNSFVHVYDTLLPLRKSQEPPHFPTFYPEDAEDTLPEEVFAEEIHPFSAPSIVFEDKK